MILGIYIIDSSGLPIVIKEYQKGFLRKIGLAEKQGDQLSVKASLVASFISAISEFSIQALGTDIKYFCSNKYCVYTMRTEDIIVMIFSSNLSPTIEAIMRELGDELNRLKVDATIIELNDKLKDKISKIVDRHFTMELSRLDELEQVYKKTLILLHRTKSELNKEFGNRCKEILKDMREKRSSMLLSKRSVTEYDINNALESLLKGEFWEAIRLTSGELEIENDEYRDCQIAIRVASGIALLTMNTDYRVISVDELVKNTYFVKNVMLKNILKRFIDLYEDGTINDIGELINIILPIQAKLKEESPCGDIIASFLGLHHLNFLYGSRVIRTGALMRYPYTKLLMEMHNSLVNYYSPEYSRKEIEKEWLDFYTSEIKGKSTEELIFSLYRSLPLLNIYTSEKEKLPDIVRYVHNLFLEVLRRYQNREFKLPIEVVAFSVYPIINFELFVKGQNRHELVTELEKFKGSLDKILMDLYTIYCQKRYPRFILDAAIIGISTIYLKLGWSLKDKSELLLKVMDNFLGDNGKFLFELNPMLYFDTFANVLFLFLHIVEKTQDPYLGAMVIEDLKNILSKMTNIPEEWLNDITYYKFETLTNLLTKKKEKLIKDFHKKT